MRLSDHVPVRSREDGTLKDERCFDQIIATAHDTRSDFNLKR